MTNPETPGIFSQEYSNKMPKLIVLILLNFWKIPIWFDFRSKLSNSPA